MSQGDPTTPPPPLEPQAWLAAIVASSDDAIVSKTLQGVVTSWNLAAERIFGWTAQEMVGRPITTIIPPERQGEEPHILARIQAGERVDHFETIRVRKDGRLIHVSVTISPIRDSSGKIVGASKIARDITLQKQVQDELRAAKEAADAANRAKDQFLSILSHELRTPLTPVLGAVSLLERAAQLPEDVRSQIGMIRRNVETEARLVDDLLDVTRIARGKLQLHFEVVDAHAACRAAVAMFQGEIDARRMEVTLALRAREFHVWADPGRFQQVLLNLVSNAIKFTPDEGSISLRTHNDGGDELVIEVSDTGVGIEADVLPQIFGAFERGGDREITRRVGGLGLGLSIVKSLMQMHHGTVTAQSEGRGRGATFTLNVQTVPPPPESRQQVPAGGRARDEDTAPPGTLRVLLVEDHADTRNVMRRLLSSFGCTVAVAGTVREALELAERETFDLLVSDIGLPDGSGLDVMKGMRARQKVRGIALSGFGQDMDLARSREAGFEMHLIKPVNFQTLHEVIQKVTSN